LPAASDSPEEAGKPKRKLNFRRLLLNKCQEEFEKGDAAMNAVAEREKKEKEGGDDDKVCGALGGVCVCVCVNVVKLYEAVHQHSGELCLNPQ
jgi:hypothetical protein